jgi:hypothetical protein
MIAELAYNVSIIIALGLVIALGRGITNIF